MGAFRVWNISSWERGVSIDGVTNSYVRDFIRQANVVARTTRQNRLGHMRNNTMIRLLVSTGLRRKELAAPR